MTDAATSLYAPLTPNPHTREGWAALMRISKGVREVRRFMNTLDQTLRSLCATTAAPMLHGLEDRVWERVHAVRTNALLARQWRTAQMLAACFALVIGVALGGAEASSALRSQQAAQLTTPSLAPSELLEGRG